MLEVSGKVSTPFMFNDPGAFINPKQNDLWKPVICAVNGMACAGALYLLGESDIIIAAEHATFFDPHVSYGMVAGFETVHLLQKLPFGEMLRVALMGGHERMSAARAHQIGLVSEVVPADELMERAMWVAQAIAMSPPLAVQGTLRAGVDGSRGVPSRRTRTDPDARPARHHLREHRGGPSKLPQQPREAPHPLTREFAFVSRRVAGGPSTRRARGSPTRGRAGGRP